MKHTLRLHGVSNRFQTDVALIDLDRSHETHKYYKIKILCIISLVIYISGICGKFKKF